jgi:hypothetical protein
MICQEHPRKNQYCWKVLHQVRLIFPETENEHQAVSLQAVL